jgi:hypothetical protein
MKKRRVTSSGGLYGIYNQNKGLFGALSGNEALYACHNVAERSVAML